MTDRKKKDTRLYSFGRNLIFRLCVLPGKILNRLIFHVRLEPIPKISGPVLILANHNTDLDPMFLGMASKKTCSFVATENIVRMGFAGRFLNRFFDLILHYKGMQGSSTVMGIMERLKKGGRVVMFPEGNRSFNGLTCPIPPATGKMCRSMRATLVTYHFTGTYFLTPRWGRGIRKGSNEGRVAGVYTPEQLRAMTPEEVQAVLERDLYEDAYETQKSRRVPFKGKHLAENLETTVFLCPSCRKIGNLHSLKRRFFCDCGYEAEFTEYGELKEKEGRIRTVTELDRLQRAELQKIAELPGELFRDLQVLYRWIDSSHRVTREGRTKLQAFRDRIRLGDREIFFTELTGVAINQKNLLMLHVEGEKEYLEITGSPSFSALKYLYLVRNIRGSASGIL